MATLRDSFFEQISDLPRIQIAEYYIPDSGSKAYPTIDTVLLMNGHVLNPSRWPGVGTILIL